MAAQREVIQACGEPYGPYDAVVVSVEAGKSGTNLQGMSWMISLGWMAAQGTEEQAMGRTVEGTSLMLRALLSNEPKAGHTLRHNLVSRTSGSSAVSSKCTSNDVGQCHDLHRSISSRQKDKKERGWYG